MLNIHGLCNTITSSIAYGGGGVLNSKTSLRIASSISSRSRRRACSSNSVCHGLDLAAVAVVAAASTAAMVLAAEIDAETLSNIPQTLSAGECVLLADCKKVKIQRPKSAKAESCTIKCVTTCIRGGQGSPGEGPLNVRRLILLYISFVLSVEKYQ